LVSQLASERFEGLSDVKSVLSRLEGAFQSAHSAATSKKSTLDAELKKQQDINDKLRKEFADAVKAFQDWLAPKKTALADKSGELVDQKSKLHKSQSEHGQAQGYLHTVEVADGKVKARNILDNKYTSVTNDDCQAQWQLFQMQFKKKLDLLDNQIEEKKKGGLTQEQLDEIKANFTYFDKDKSNLIDRRELRACLQSLGEDATRRMSTR